MKKFIITAIAISAFGFINAQEVKFGAKAALNIATLTGDVEDPSSLIGFQVGGFAEIKISEKFAIQPELLYSTQGGKEKESIDIDGTDYTATLSYKLSYITIPVMAKYYVAKSFSLEIGPQIGFLTSAKGEIEASGESVEVDIKDYVTSTDFGVNFGAGYDFSEKLSASLRYNLGLSNINDDEEDDSNIKNSVFSIALGYKF